ncbi:hypothetical protein K493DRAFT_341408 [Basidiobolus meristosporus CBS 931.73]|uniref:FYVE-domain-containing protein n=1 Tax=Basidiobolus meristosporus CBS 931.73 TaxID=1314790 RepID=A0A1Y1XRY0_9FUNG|nr:hypothetical protein K493DRAFT_341408 [Basidiobolus meristosporus CBS 931.73]|eukprot:ORX88054.1 hypothetical protein K493DRAFT_341408 [Basidiobolus meristosporus CBS 931.73]
MIRNMNSSVGTTPRKKSQLFIDLKDLPKFEEHESLTSTSSDSQTTVTLTNPTTRPHIRSPLINARSLQAPSQTPKKMLAMTPPLPRFSHPLVRRATYSEEPSGLTCSVSRRERVYAKKALNSPVSFEDMHKITEIEFMFVNGRSLLHPGRVFVKEGELVKDTGKTASPRRFFLFTDVLVYGTPLGVSSRYGSLDNQTIINLAYSKVEHISQAQWSLRLYTKQESFCIVASSELEYTSWFHALQNSIACHKTKLENEAKKRRLAAIKNGKRRSSFSLDMSIWKTIKNIGSSKDGFSDRSSDSSRPLAEGERKYSFSSVSSVSTLFDGECKAKWVPDEEASCCMSCKVTKFSMMIRRHHCRLCGRVICWKCSHLREHINTSGQSVRICKDCLTWKAVGAVISQGETPQSQHLSPPTVYSVIRDCPSDASSTMAMSCSSNENSVDWESSLGSPEEYFQVS